MSDSFWTVILYAAHAGGLSDRQKEFLDLSTRSMVDLDVDSYRQALSQRVSPEEMKKVAKNIPQEQRAFVYLLAKEVAEIDGPSESEQKALSELRSALSIETSDLDLLTSVLEDDVDSGEEGSFHTIASRYCKITAVCSLLPLPFVSDALVMVPLQIRMVKKIAKIYGYPLDAHEFVKMIIDKAGPEYASAVAGRMAISLVPVFGWIACAGITYGLTYAVALVAREYIERQGEMDTQTIRSLYKDAYHEGRQKFEHVKDEIRRDKVKLIEKLNEMRNEDGLVKRFEDRFRNHETS